jgi:medium-chain acyl-[acyl-carrier-protein] hydrolase
VRLKIELCSIRIPGHEARTQEPLFDQLPPLIDSLAPSLRHYSNSPFIFVGHSMGALISFELARLLRRVGLPGPVHMIVSGHRAPQLPDVHPAIHELSDAEFLANIQRLGGTPEAVLQDTELIELVMPLLRADFAVCENYVYTAEEPLDCSITAFGGSNDIKVSRDEISAWQMQTSKSFCQRIFPGDHFFIQTAQAAVLQVLSQDLRQALRRSYCDIF